jgi:hypothetical protein
VVEGWTFFGPYVRLHVNAGGELLAVDAPQEVLLEGRLRPRERVTVQVPPDAVLVFPARP